ncbi:unnamed protein product [Caenorhabditis brenneri]
MKRIKTREKDGSSLFSLSCFSYLLSAESRMLIGCLLLSMIMAYLPTAIASEEDIADAAIRILTKADVPSNNPIDRIQAWGPLSLSVMKVAIEITHLAREKPEPDTENFKILEKFESRTKGIWKDMRRQADATKIKLGDISDHPWGWNKEYKDFSDSIDSIVYYTDDTRKMTRQDDREIERLKNICALSPTNPGGIGSLSAYHLERYCDNPITSGEAQEISEHRLYLFDVMHRLNVKWEQPPDNCDQYILDFIAIYKHLKTNDKKNILEEDLGVFHRQFATYQEGMTYFLNELKMKGGIPFLIYDTCPLRPVLTKFGFNHKAVESFVVRLENDIIRLAFASGACDQFYTEDNKKATGESLISSRMNDHVVKISSVMAKYFNESLAASWPSAHNGVLFKEIRNVANMTGSLNSSQLEKLVARTRDKLEETGQPGYTYAFSLINKPDKNFQSLQKGYEKYCSYNNSRYGFETVIRRIPIDQLDKLDKDKTQAQKERLDAAIQKNLIGDGLYTAPTLDEIAPVLLKKFNESLNPYKCMVVARRWQYFCPVVLNSWMSSATQNKTESSMIKLEYEASGRLWRDCQAFTFLLL